MSSSTAYIGIGANLGPARNNVEQALRRLDTLPQSHVSARSSLFLSAPIEADGADYVNAVAQLQTSLAPEQLLQRLLAMEHDFGRVRSYRNAPRLLDLDILLYGSQIIHSATLEVPHPRLAQRAFTLLPLLQLDPFIDIPGMGPAHGFVGAVADQRIQKIET